MLCITAALSGQLLVGQESITPGALDSTFESHVDRGLVEAVLRQPDGRLLVGGSFSSPGAGANLVRLTSDGAPDATFTATSGVPGHVTKLALQPDGKVLAGNKGGVDGGYPAIGLSRFLPDGSRDPSFGFGLPTNSINNGIWSGFWTTALTVQPDGKILLAGHFERDHFDYWYWSAVSLQRLRPDGSEDEFFTFAWPSPRSIQVLVVLPDQRILVAGDQLARLNGDGTEDAGFLRTILSTGQITCCIPQADGKILVGGSFTSLQGYPRCRIARILADGQLDLSFNPPVSRWDSDPNDTIVSALAVQPDGRILVGGNFETMNGLPYLALARLDSDGSLDTTFPPILRRDEDDDAGLVRSIVVQDGTRALIGGEHMITCETSDPSGLFRIHLGEPSPRLSILRISGNTVQLKFSSPGHYDYTVLKSTNLTLPASDWSALGCATNVGGNLYQLTDELSPSEAHSFYQLRRTAAR